MADVELPMKRSTSNSLDKPETINDVDKTSSADDSGSN